VESKNTNSGKRKKLPPFVKAAFIKFWFGGAVYFFVGWGLFLNTSDQLDLVLVLGLALGLCTDLLVNNILRGMNKDGDYSRYMMFPRKRFLSFLLNVIYGICLSFVVAYTYHFINIAAIGIFNLHETSVVLGAEPILYGVFCMSYDMLFLLIKKSIIKKDGTIKNEN